MTLNKMDKFIIFTDGGARGNPGPAAIGFVIYNNNQSQILFKSGEYIGETTNNQAEYTALIKALKKAADLNAKIIVCYLDSELVVKQLLGLYKVREKGLQELISQVFKLTKNFESIEYKHVLREKNKLADKLVNEALDKVETNGNL